MQLNRRHRQASTFIGNKLLRLSDAVWLGLLRERHLQAITDQAYARDHILTSRSHNTAGLNAVERRMVDEWFPQRGRALVLGAGGGREAVALCRRGLEVEAVDCSPPLVDSARRTCAELGVSAAVHLRVPGDLDGFVGPYDVVLLGLGAYSHMPGRAARVALLAGLRERATESVLMLSFYPRRGGGRSLAHRLSTAVARLSGNPRRPEPSERLADTYAVSFSLSQIVDELDSGGWLLRELDEGGMGYALAVPA